MYKSNASGLLLFTALNCLCPIKGFRRHPSLYNQDTHPNDPLGNTLLHDQIIAQEIVKSAETTPNESNVNYRKLKSNLPQQHMKPSDHLVTDLPYLGEGVFTSNHYAGHIPASDADDKKLFYWLFEPDFSDDFGANQNDGDVPLLIWLNGGPGCSSMDGLFLENGPFRLVHTDDHKEQWTIETNEYSWHKAPAYVLYIDQPVGTGLSFTKKGKFCKNDLEVNVDFHLFLENFLLMYQDFFLNDKSHAINGQRTMKRPLYFSGESHAGHYIPSMMDYILQRNDDTSAESSSRVKINLKGSAIGNGWIDPYYQYAASDLAYSIGMIDLAQKESLDKKEKICRDNLLHGNFRSNVCFDLLDDIISDSSGKKGAVRMSIYDNRKWETSGKARTFPPGHKDVEAYLGGWHQSSIGMTVPYEDVLKSIHAEESINAKQRFQECTDPPYMALQHQDGKGVVKEFVSILEHETKPKMLIFNGMNDMICNHVGNEKLLENLDWEHVDKWKLAKRYAWNYKSNFVESIDGSTSLGPAGYYKEYDNLIFLKIASSGHMVPMDLPDLSLEMMRKLMYQESFAGNFQALDGSLADKTTDCPSCPTCASSEKSIIHDGNHDGDDDEIEEADESRILLNKQFLSGGWIGIVLGISFMVMYNVMKNKRIVENHIIISRENDIYRDDPETELVLSTRKVIDDGEYI